MRIQRTALALALLASVACAYAETVFPPDAKDRIADVDTLCRFVSVDYAYLERKTTDWAGVCAQARDAAAKVGSRDEFVLVLEDAVHALYDAHAHLGTSAARSTRLVPTDTDVVAHFGANDVATIVDVRAGSAAEAAGVRAGMRVLRVDGNALAEAVRVVEPRPLRAPDPAARDFALQLALAGHQDGQPVQLVVLDGERERELAFVPELKRPKAPITPFDDRGVAIIRINNALGDRATIAAFDRALDAMPQARALILDLRDTPSGGTSVVARGIMGRLVSAEAPYQRHELVSEQRANRVRRVWVEYVEPRGKPFQGPVAVLVGPWTGSMGEGIAIGLHAARGARVVGRPMAQLAGALDEIELPHSHVVVRVPTEMLFHVNGTPREAFVVQALEVRPDDRREGDAELAATVRMLAR